MIAQWYQTLFQVSLFVLGVLLFLCLVRTVKGPSVADRIVGVNMMTTIVTVIIGVLAVMLHEDYLADVAIIYAMLGFLAVVVLTRIYMGVYFKAKAAEKKKEEGNG